MLPQQQRLRTSDDFRRVVRRGVRVGRPTLVLHAVSGGGPEPRVGFVVSRQVGNAVVRNRVKRRLRHLASDRLRDVRRPVDVVVRALPTAGSGELSSDFGTAWDTAMTKLEAA